MKVKELVKHLSVRQQFKFQLGDGTLVPDHFHVTEMGLMLKNYVDCGGKMRSERSATFQLSKVLRDRGLRQRQVIDNIPTNARLHFQ